MKLREENRLLRQSSDNLASNQERMNEEVRMLRSELSEMKDAKRLLRQDSGSPRGNQDRGEMVSEVSSTDHYNSNSGVASPSLNVPSVLCDSASNDSVPCNRTVDFPRVSQDSSDWCKESSFERMSAHMRGGHWSDSYEFLGRDSDLREESGERKKKKEKWPRVGSRGKRKKYFLGLGRVKRKKKRKEVALSVCLA